MRPSKVHLVTSCQQLLALGAVLAVLTPAASVISLDVVQRTPADRGAGADTRQSHAHPVALSAYARETQRSSRVPTSPVDADLTEYPLTASPGAASREGAAGFGRTLAGTADQTSVLSRPAPVRGYGGVGVTWAPGPVVDDEDLSFSVRTRSDGDWSRWLPLEYHDEHAPDPDSPEGREARPGTDVLFVGDVDDVQVRADADGIVPPSGMSMAVVSPGEPVETEREAPAISTTATGAQPAARTVAARNTSGLATFTPKPQIYSRAQWGADESLRDKGSLRYYEVHAGFVHHTVNANGYSRAEVPGILRSIYAYHTQSRGWSDVGYNFLVDRFGRIWEGRYGGVDRPVVGAHTLGYNDYAFAMSAIGNFDVAKPRSAMIEAYGALFAWKLSLHGVDAASDRQRVGPDTFQAINGHRDAGSTACPGRYLYARLDDIRALAAANQQDWSGRELQSDLAGSPHPDLIVRRASDKQAFVIPTGGLSGFARPVVNKGLATGARRVVPTPDVTRDGIGDLLIQGKDGTTDLRAGDGLGGYTEVQRSFVAFADIDLLTGAGDVDGDGRADLVGRDAAGRPALWRGKGDGRFSRQRTSGDWSSLTDLNAGGDLDGDGHADLLGRDATGALIALPGTASGFGTAVPVAGSFKNWDSIVGQGDLTGDGRPDLLARSGRKSPGWIIPSRGGFAFGEPRGPIGRFRAAGLVTGGGSYLGDQMPDVVSRRGKSVRTYRNLGTVDVMAPIATGVRLRGANVLLNAGDWDRDGDGDLIYRNRKGRLILRPGDGNGHFGDRNRIGRGFGDVQLLAAVGDMTGDGWPDLMGQPRGSSMRIYPGNGSAGLKESYVAHSAIAAGQQIGVGRWDRDGSPDSLFRSGRSLAVYPGNGPGGLTNRRSLSFDIGGYDWVVGVSSLRMRGHGDIIVREKATGVLYALQANARKGIKSRRVIGDGMEVYDLVG